MAVSLSSLPTTVVRERADAAHAAAVAALDAGASRSTVERHTRVWERALRELEGRGL